MLTSHDPLVSFAMLSVCVPVSQPRAKNILLIGWTKQCLANGEAFLISTSWMAIEALLLLTLGDKNSQDEYWARIVLLEKEFVGLCMLQGVHLQVLNIKSDGSETHNLTYGYMKVDL
ncbi:unnamed protein product, partial [Timema podura]|nr:unnamed protein product [Timema podura]